MPAFTKTDLELLEVAVRLRLESAQENEEADGKDGKAWVKKWGKLLEKINNQIAEKTPSKEDIKELKELKKLKEDIKELNKHIRNRLSGN